jgi:steroid delta-isomerase-like uncharacterized protein
MRDDLVAKARRFVTDVWNGRREESVHDLVAADCPGFGGKGPDAVLAWHHDRRAAFPDVCYEIVDVLAADNRAVVRWHATGTQLGEFGPVPPTGRKVSYHGVTFMYFDADGKIADVWSVNELFQVLQQLGVEFVPPPAGE